MNGGPGTKDLGQIDYSNVTLADVIRQAYNVHSYQLRGGPAWLDSERFHIVAKVPAGASKEDLRAMFRGLLAERFHLGTHRETPDGRSYDLVVDKGGPKLKAPTGGAAPGQATIGIGDAGAPEVAANAMGRPVALAGKNLLTMFSGGSVILLANSQPMSRLAETLTGLMDGPVRDATELAGVYDFTLDFAAPPGAPTGPAGPPPMYSGAAPNDEPPLSVFQAVREKLGLRLEVRHGPIEVLVIDRVEKVPTAN
jgi:uncharacterized protein (TIGR03435 family)